MGIEECAKRIANMIESGKEEAGIDKETRLTSCGLSLSGCEQVGFLDLLTYQYGLVSFKI